MPDGECCSTRARARPRASRRRFISGERIRVEPRSVVILANSVSTDISRRARGTIEDGVMPLPASTPRERTLAFARLDCRLHRVGDDVSGHSRRPRVGAGGVGGRAPVHCRRHNPDHRAAPDWAAAAFPAIVGRVSLSGFLLLVIGNGAVVWAEQYVASGLTAVMVAMVPFWNVVVEAIRAGRRAADDADYVRSGDRVRRDRRAGLAGAVHGYRRQLVRRWCHRLTAGVRRLGGRHIVHQAQHRLAIAGRNVGGADARRRSDVPGDRHRRR